MAEWIIAYELRVKLSVPVDQLSQFVIMEKARRVIARSTKKDVLEKHMAANYPTLLDSLEIVPLTYRDLDVIDNEA